MRCVYDGSLGLVILVGDAVGFFRETSSPKKCPSLRRRDVVHRAILLFGSKSKRPHGGCRVQTCISHFG